MSFEKDFLFKTYTVVLKLTLVCNLELQKEQNNFVFIFFHRGWLGVSLFIYLFICRISRMTTLRFASILLHHAPPKVALVLMLFVIFGASC